MLTLFKKIFTWWNQDTLGTRINTILFGKLVGKDVFGNRTVVVAREMTIIHEEFKKAPIAELDNYFSAPRGEITLIIDVVNKEQLQKE